jgi:hypothetical protein
MRSYKLPLKCLLTFIPVLAGGFAWSETVTLEPAKDNTMYSEDATLSNGQGDSLFAGRTRGSQGTDRRRALVQFDLTGAIPAGSTIESASLRLYVSKIPDGDAGDYIFEVFRLTRDWGEGASIGPEFAGKGVPAEEGDTTWNHAFYATETWTTPGGDFVETASAFEVLSGTGLYEWYGAGIAADVQEWVDNPDGNFGWIVIGQEDLLSSARVFASRHYFNTVLRPTLTVTYTEGSATWAGYPVDGDGRSVDTGNFLGWIDIAEEPWIYVYSLNKYIYAPVDNISASGGWVWIGQ